MCCRLINTVEHTTPNYSNRYFSLEKKNLGLFHIEQYFSMRRTKIEMFTVTSSCSRFDLRCSKKMPIFFPKYTSYCGKKNLKKTTMACMKTQQLEQLPQPEFSKKGS